MISFRLLLCILFSCIVSSQAQTNPYENEIRAFEAEDATNRPPPNSIVFIGSSTINMWNSLAADFPKYNVLNRGFGGSQTSDAVYFVDRIATPYRPPLIAFYEGDNDLAAGKTVDQVFKDTTNFFGLVQSKSPNTHILYISVKPSPSRASSMPAMAALNEKVKTFTEANPKLHYADLYTPMLNTSGQPRPELFLSDNLHMNATGYALWKSVLSPVLDGIAAGYPIPVSKTDSGSMLIDFGAADSLSGSSGGTVVWNNITTGLGTSSNGTAVVVTTTGASAGVTLQMVSRFNGANENGTAVSSLFPTTATRDSLFGNTESFSGLANITPIFKLTNLSEGVAYRLTFYASRTGTSDNRQTRYTVTGATTATADLNPANNVDQIVTISSMQADDDRAITIALTSGPSNNNANHFTYLGVLRVESMAPGGPTYLFDFGAAGSTTGAQSGPPGIVWNNLLPEVGATNNGILPDLVKTNGLSSGIALEMISRFNGSNLNGATNSTLFPATATQDSLYGNTEPFNGLANIAPAFRLKNLQQTALYDFSFYASRSGVADNRETRYVVTGATTNEASLNASGNIDNIAAVIGIAPNGAGEIRISLEPGPNNNNANHFTYLGILRASWRSAGSPPPVEFLQASSVSDVFQFTVAGAPGMIYTLQASTNLQVWQSIRAIEMSATNASVQIDRPETSTFYRLLQ